MRLLELFLGRADYDMRTCLRIVVLCLGVELGVGRRIGLYARLTWPWACRGGVRGRWILLENGYQWCAADTLRRIAAWWRRCGWNANGMSRFGQ